MKQVNLLPWRQSERDARRQYFYWLLGASVGLAIVFVVLVHLFIASQISSQEFRNNYLTQQKTLLDAQIAQIKTLNDQKEKVLQRMSLIKSLQENRPEAVHIFSEFAKITPDGVYLTSMKRADSLVTLTGKAESNTSVSVFMKNIDSSKWLGNSTLSEINTDNKATSYNNSFTLQIKLPNLSAMPTSTTNSNNSSSTTSTTSPSTSTPPAPSASSPTPAPPTSSPGASQ